MNVIKGHLNPQLATKIITPNQQNLSWSLEQVRKIADQQSKKARTMTGFLKKNIREDKKSVVLKIMTTKLLWQFLNLVNRFAQSLRSSR